MPDQLDRAVPQPQDGVTYADKIGKAEASIDWNAPAALIERRVRASDPFPGAVFDLDGEPVKLWRARVFDDRGEPGRCLAGPPGSLRVACGQGALELRVLQRTGGRRTAVADFLHGRPVPPGTRLSSASR